MDEKQTRVFKETRLRNLQRTYVKLSQHVDLVEETLAIKNEINILKSELE